MRRFQQTVGQVARWNVDLHRLLWPLSPPGCATTLRGHLNTLRALATLGFSVVEQALMAVEVQVVAVVVVMAGVERAHTKLAENTSSNQSQASRQVTHSQMSEYLLCNRVEQTTSPRATVRPNDRRDKRKQPERLLQFTKRMIRFTRKS